jgi:hypothetical protein
MDPSDSDRDNFTLQVLQVAATQNSHRWIDRPAQDANQQHPAVVVHQTTKSPSPCLLRCAGAFVRAISHMILRSCWEREMDGWMDGWMDLLHPPTNTMTIIHGIGRS